MERIDHPKVFISYAWGSEDYQMKVLAFATALCGDGIEVLLDKWQIAAGNDMNNFMEKSVNDPSVTNVLILLDENYAEKANKRTGGVGTETQIISQQVYASVEQTKFIPVVFERNAAGEVCKPTYLQSRLHFDLSREDSYNSEYQNLVRTLYGIEIYKHPKTGARPSWVDDQISVAPKTLTAYDMLKENKPQTVKEGLLQSYLEKIEQAILEYANVNYGSISLEQYIEAYEANRGIRKDYLVLLEKASNCDNWVEQIGDFLESTENRLEENSSLGHELGHIFLHELFLYTIALLLKRKNYSEIGYLLGRTYFPARSSGKTPDGKSYTLFYSDGLSHRNLDNAVNKRDNKNYHSGTAEYWISTIDQEVCSKDEFTAADLLCYNYAIYGKDYLDHWHWFPITYVYANEYSNYITKLARQLISREKLKKILPVFNYDTEEEFKNKCELVEKGISEGKYKEYRYNMAFESAPLLSEHIKASDMGTVR